MQHHKQYLVHFASTAIESAKAGVDVCLAINVLELPLHIAIDNQVWQLWQQSKQPFATQLMSLCDFDEVHFYLIQDKDNNQKNSDYCKLITNNEFNNLILNKFLLTF